MTTKYTLCSRKYFPPRPRLKNNIQPTESAVADAEIIEAAQNFLKLDKIFQSDGVEQKNAK